MEEKATEFEIKKINFDADLGHGPIGRVLPFKNKPNWVMKEITARSFKDFRAFVKGVMQNTNHDYPGILCPKKVYIPDPSRGSYQIMVKYERMKGSLQNVMNDQRGKADPNSPTYFSIDEIKGYIYPIVVSLSYLHKKGIAHRNLKPNNIFFNNDNEKMIRISDIGQVREFSDNDTTHFTGKKGPEFYQAPELFRDDEKPKNKIGYMKLDSWSLGMLIVDFCLKSPKNILPFSSNEAISNTVKTYIEQIKSSYGDRFSRLVEGLLIMKVSERKTIDEFRQSMKEMFPEINEPMGNILSEQKPSGNDNKTTSNQLVVDDMKKSFGPNFRIGFKKGLDIKAVEPSKIQDDKIDEFVTELAKKIQQHKAKKPDHMSINFKGCEITDEGLKKSLIKIGSDFNNLKDFSFALGPSNFNGNCKVTDEGLKHLSMNINQSLTDLQSLTLDLNDCELITDTGIKALVADICGNLQGIQQLSLEFGLGPSRENTKQVTDEVLKYISVQIGRKLHELISLSLTFRGYSEITDSGIQNLESDLVRRIEGLEKLSLRFYRCENITGDGVRQLAKGVSDTQRNLKQLAFVFSFCDQVSKEDKAEISEILKFVPKLTL